MLAQHDSAQPEGTAGEARAQLVTCPRCSQQFPLTAALAEELAGQVLAGKEPLFREEIATELRGAERRRAQQAAGPAM